MVGNPAIVAAQQVACTRVAHVKGVTALREAAEKRNRQHQPHQGPVAEQTTDVRERHA